MATRKIQRKIGDIVLIPLGDRGHSYAHVSTNPCIIFYDGIFESELSVDEIVQLPELFNLSVNDRALEGGEWAVIGRYELREEQLKRPYRYKQDMISGELSLYHSDFSSTDYERPATLDECKGLECAAVWNPDHVVERIKDFYDGKPNKWAEQLKIDESRIP